MATTRPSPKILSPTASVETMLGVSISRHTKWFSLVAHSIKNLPAIKDESEVTQSCLTLCDPMGCSLPGSSVYGIFQERVLEWVAISFSRGSSKPRDWTRISRTTDRHFTVLATREAHSGYLSSIPGSGEIPWIRKWQPTPVFLPGKSHAQRSLAGYSLWDRKSQTRLSD